MPTSGLVLTAERPEHILPILAALAGEQSIAAGEPVGLRLPVVLDTPDKAADKRVWSWLSSLPGVVSIDVAFISWDTPMSTFGLSLPIEQSR
jgi:hypothetical protein